MHNFAGAREQTDAAPRRVCMRGALLPDAAASAAAAVILMSALCMRCVVMAHIMPLSRPLLALGASACASLKCHVSADAVFSPPLSIMPCNVVKALARPVPTLICACVALCFVSSVCSTSEPQRVFKRQQSLLFYSCFIVFILLREVRFFFHLSLPPHH